jgi:hypothetical protein
LNLAASGGRRLAVPRERDQPGYGYDAVWVQQQSGQDPALPYPAEIEDPAAGTHLQRT